LLTKSKVFFGQILMRKTSENSLTGWDLLDKTTEVDKLINDWVEQTSNQLVYASPPSIHMEWMDKENTVKMITSSVTVLYVEPEASENE
jgi:hypothetical protein